MKFEPADGASLALFVAMCGVMFAITTNAMRRAGATTGYFVAWIGALVGLGLVVRSGVIATHPMPAIPCVFAVLMFGAVAFALSPVGRRLSATGSLALLVGFQAFRLPLELLLHHWANIGTIPETMTWTGQNLDIIAGAVALVAIPFVRSRAVAWGTQVIGVVLLVNVMRVVVMSSPLPFAWSVEPPLQLIGHLPYALIGPLFVAPAIAAHVITIRALLARPT